MLVAILMIVLGLAIAGCGGGQAEVAALAPGDATVPDPAGGRMTQQGDVAEGGQATAALTAVNLAVTQCVMESASGGFVGCEAAAAGTPGVRAAAVASEPTGYALSMTTPSGVTYVMTMGAAPSRTCSPVGVGCSGTF